MTDERQLKEIIEALERAYLLINTDPEEAKSIIDLVLTNLRESY